MNKKLYEDSEERLFFLRSLALGERQGSPTGYASIEIYPLEIENKILEISGVSDAVFISSQDLDLKLFKIV